MTRADKELRVERLRLGQCDTFLPRDRLGRGSNVRTSDLAEYLSHHSLWDILSTKTTGKLRTGGLIEGAQVVTSMLSKEPQVTSKRYPICTHFPRYRERLLGSSSVSMMAIYSLGTILKH